MVMIVRRRRDSQPSVASEQLELGLGYDSSRQGTER
jgi:hypothetical protein